MPELPEVEYTARQLRTTIVGATISEALVFWERTIGYPDLPTFLVQIAGRRIQAVRRRGKFLLLDLDDEFIMTVHRRMTGNLLIVPPGWEIDTSLRQSDPVAWNTKGPTFRKPAIHQPTSPGDSQSAQSSTDLTDCATPAPGASLLAYCRVCFNLADGRRLLFTDPRKFGRIELWPRQLEGQALAGLGLEPLSDEFTVERLAEALAKRRSAIKQVLLDQAVVAGIGNIYADEALFHARIHPRHPAHSLTPGEVQRLHQGIVSVLTLGIEHGGTSFNDYRDLWGEAGDNYNHVWVYQREGQPCLRCGTPIERIIIVQRSTHFCPACQKLTLE